MKISQELYGVQEFFEEKKSKGHNLEIKYRGNSHYHLYLMHIHVPIKLHEDLPKDYQRIEQNTPPPPKKKKKKKSKCHNPELKKNVGA